MGFTGELAVLAEGVAFLPSFANVIAFETGEGLVLVDTGGFLLGDHVHAQLRAWTDQPLHTAIFTHGHVDHVFGVPPFEAEAPSAGGALRAWSRTRTCRAGSPATRSPPATTARSTRASSACPS